MISVTILTKNCQETLEATLNSLVRFEEVLLLDSGSEDQTLEIARRFSNVRIETHAFLGFGPMHNLATSLTRSDWVLSIDSDEVLSPALVEEILSLSLDPSCVYALQRRNYFEGKWVRCCAGWHPDWVRRLYHRQKTRFDDLPVHEKVLLGTLQEVRLIAPLCHTPYRKIEDFLSKMQTYSALFAEQNAAKKPTSLPKALLHSLFAFLKSYVLKRGFLGGSTGVILSLYNAQTTFYKYLKQRERARKS